MIIYECLSYIATGEKNVITMGEKNKQKFKGRKKRRVLVP